MKYIKTKGFTIVELLIVIVVIAVLASISVVAFRGATERAERSRVYTEVASWYKVLSVYRLQQGEALGKTANLTQDICLGVSAPAVDLFPADRCMIWKAGESTNGGSTPTNPAAMTILRNQAGTLPSDKVQSVLYTDPINWPGWGEIYYRGITYSYNSTSTEETLTFWLEGDTSCGSYSKVYAAGMNVSQCTKVIKP